MAAEVPWMVHALSLGTPAGLALTYYDGSLFSYHVAAMSFTFLFLLPQGLFLAAASFKHKQRGRLVTYHFRVQMGALALAVAGISAMFCHRHRLHKPHFNTAHARLGVATVLLSEVAGLVGMLLYFGVPRAYRKSLLLQMLLVHRAMGRLAVVLGAVTILTALHILEPQHHRHRGLSTYIAASAIVAQLVGMHSVLWPLTTRSKWQYAGSPVSASSSGTNLVDRHSAASPLTGVEKEIDTPGKGI